ncbi:hypothetical protein [Suttonella ornithocola]|uniref:Uncharacterized protein n=1 Tax=Suttonella ornithocola TaxID=279832 RepID=A0A380MVV1_9GAMM|nr:hypothetical protein [Suttonella ornithocola]SUO96685.1 Uncharacterised protein [Suttonella ornithocola]
MKKKFINIGGIGRFLKFSIFLLLFISLSIGIFSLLGIQKVQEIENIINSGWWIASIIRWLIIGLTIAFLPKLLRYMVNKLTLKIKNIQEQLDLAKGQNAQYETLQQLQNRVENLSRIRSSYINMEHHKKWLAFSLIGIEVFFVQFPHLV